jgi:nucleoside-diphosphate-sugar epimerase
LTALRHPEPPAALPTQPTRPISPNGPIRPTVLVLGGTGFIGQALVQRLLQEGLALRVLVRPRSDRAAGPAQPGVEWMQGDCTATAALEAALEGIQHVYHLARGSGPAWDDYLRSEVEPTRRLAQLCCARGVTLFYVSSIAIYDGGLAGACITESTPPCPAAMRLNAYARAKVESERLLTQMHREHGLKAVIFRPGIVIGPGGNLQHPGVGAWPNPSTCRPWGGGSHSLPFVLVDDCVDALARALHLPGIAGQSFNLIGDAPLSGNGYLDALERSSGARIQRRPLPAWRLFAQSAVKWGATALSRHAKRPLPSYRYCDGLSCRASYGAEHAKQQLGWAPTSDPAVLIAKGVVAALPSGLPMAGPGL